MTDLPAVIYIKASQLSKQGERNTIDANPRKKLKADENDKSEKEELKELMGSFNREITKKLDDVDKRLDSLADYYDILNEKVKLASKQLNSLKTKAREQISAEENGLSFIPVSSKVAFVSLNREEDYPFGSWLGNPNDPENRVRCHISPTDLFHIHTTCTTAEKMALTLLDYLFDRETQACSNISGTGKHKKKQLDPLLVFGIRCHLNFHFGTAEQEWLKIKQNMDSKCRTAFRRKMRGLPLANKGASRMTPHVNQLDVPLESLEDFQDSVSPEDFIEDRIIEELTGENVTFRVVKSESESIILERAIKEISERRKTFDHMVDCYTKR